jgi:hypothetical protein
MDKLGQRRQQKQTPDKNDINNRVRGNGEKLKQILDDTFTTDLGGI